MKTIKIAFVAMLMAVGLSASAQTEVVVYNNTPYSYHLVFTINGTAGLPAGGASILPYSSGGFTLLPSTVMYTFSDRVVLSYVGNCTPGSIVNTAIAYFGNAAASGTPTPAHCGTPAPNYTWAPDPVTPGKSILTIVQ